MDDIFKLVVIAVVIILAFLIGMADIRVKELRRYEE